MLKDKVVVITGAGGLIGQAFVKGVIEQGGAVVIADIDVALANKVHEQLYATFGKSVSLPVYLDINNKQSIEDLIATVTDTYGKIDALVNNAYPRNKQYGQQFLDVTLESFNENVSLHLGGYFLMCQQFIKYFLQQQSGKIVNMASVYGCIAPKFEVYENTNMTMPVEYAAIKAGVIHLSKYMAKYVKGHNIQVNCISPGGVLNGQDDSFLEKYKESCIAKGMLDSKDLVATLQFLLSSGSDAITGQNIIVDDGFCL